MFYNLTCANRYRLTSKQIHMRRDLCIINNYVNEIFLKLEKKDLIHNPKPVKLQKNHFRDVGAKGYYCKLVQNPNRIYSCIK